MSVCEELYKQKELLTATFQNQQITYWDNTTDLWILKTF